MSASIKYKVLVEVIAPTGYNDFMKDVIQDLIPRLNGFYWIGSEGKVDKNNPELTNWKVKFIDKDPEEIWSFSETKKDNNNPELL